MESSENISWRFDRHIAVERRWRRLARQRAWHQQEAELIRLEQIAVASEMIALREDFFDDSK